VNFPKSPKTRAALAVGIAATAVVMIVGPGSTAATAGRLIGSAAIKNNTIRSLDIRNGTITGRDVKDGSLTAKDFSGALRGATGPRGPAGPPGTAGGADSGDVRTIKTWTVHNDGQPFLGRASFNSRDSVPAGTLVEVVSMVVTGDFSECHNRGTVALLMPGANESLALSEYGNGEWMTSLPRGGGAIAATANPLVVSAICQGEFVVPVPDFDAVITLAFTEGDTAGTFD
jgi:hypothetical protein